MKTYKLDVAGKIGQLREQLQDKVPCWRAGPPRLIAGQEEELRDLEKKSGKTSHKK